MNTYNFCSFIILLHERSARCYTTSVFSKFISQKAFFCNQRSHSQNIFYDRKIAKYFYPYMIYTNCIELIYEITFHHVVDLSGELTLVSDHCSQTDLWL